MEGDDELLAQTEVKVEPKRDEWMTTLPPERKVSPVNHLFLSFRVACRTQEVREIVAPLYDDII